MRVKKKAEQRLVGFGRAKARQAIFSMNLKQCYIALFFNGSSMLGIIEADGIKGLS